MSQTGTMLDGTPYRASSNSVASAYTPPLAGSRTRHVPPVYGADNPHQSMGRPAEADKSASVVLTTSIDNTLSRPIMIPVESSWRRVALAMSAVPPGKSTVPSPLVSTAPWMRLTTLSNVTLLSGQVS